MPPKPRSEQEKQRAYARIIASEKSDKMGLVWGITVAAVVIFGFAAAVEALGSVDLPFEWIDWVIFALLGMLVPYGFYMSAREKETREIEMRLPDFLRDVSEAGRFGMTLADAVVVASSGRIVGATLGNDVNLRDVEGRSALLLGRAKDNNASAALGPMIRLFDDGFSLEDIRRAEIALTISGRDGFTLDERGAVGSISRDPWGSRADKSPDRIGLFWKLQLATGIVTAISFLVVWALLHIPEFQPRFSEFFLNPQQPSGMYFRESGQVFISRRLMLANLVEYFLPIIILVLPASLIMGGGLPLLDRIAITSAQVSGKRVGDIHLANIVGSLSGTLVVSFVFLAHLGTELTLKVLALLSIAFTALVWKPAGGVKRNIHFLPACVLALIFILPWRGELYIEDVSNRHRQRGGGTRVARQRARHWI